MGTPQVAYVVAGEREKGRRCPTCAVNVQAGEPVSICYACGAVHHQACWLRNPVCCAITSAPSRPVMNPEISVLKITHEDLEQALPLPPRLPVGVPSFTYPARELPRTNRLAVAAFVVALAGIPFFGLLTGLVAVVLGCLALGTLQNSGQRGLVLAVLGVLLGLADVVGWLLLLYYVFSHPAGLAGVDVHRPAVCQCLLRGPVPILLGLPGGCR
jgi:hypothetical protein